MILLELHAAAGAEATLAARELVVDRGAVERQAGGHAVEDAVQRRAVGFTGGQEAQPGQEHRGAV